MKYSKHILLSLLVIAAVQTAVADAFITMHNLFHDHMVLQRDLDVPLWGTGTPGGSVTVLLDGAQVGSAIVDSNGDWEVRLTPHANDGGVSHTLQVEMGGASTITFSDVIFGDVYLASGQSNMALRLAFVTGFNDIYVNDRNPYIRQVLLTTSSATSLQYEPSVNMPWEETDGATIRWITAVGYFFAKNLYEQTGVPVGLINAAYASQPINRFLNPEGMNLVPQLSGELADYAQGGTATTNLYEVYNAMIGPLVPYGIRGFLWYQGEADCGTGALATRSCLYEEKMRALIRGFRTVWGEGDLPFYYVQLPNYQGGGWTVLRERQLNVLTETNTGMIVTIDVGEDANLHPTNKQDPGYRLAQWALAKQFDRRKIYSGPIYQSSIIEGSAIRVLFDYADGGLLVGQKTSTNPVVEVASGTLENFEIAGSNRVFVSATAVIDADSVIVSAASVAAPKYVRYCYASTPSGTNKLYNSADLPAAPFRTDESVILSIASGSGTLGSVLPGTVCSITATSAPEGKVFDRWIGAAGGVADLNSSATTVTMPAHDLYLTATYRDSSAAVYSLDVLNGTGDGTAQEGAIVNIEADAPAAGTVFDSWQGSGSSLLVDAAASETTLQMPASNVTVQATYRTVDVSVPPDISNFTLSGSQAQLNFPGQAGYRYALEWTTNLTSGTWSTVFYNVKGDGLTNALAFPLETNNTAFYRVRLKN